jgi:hypothetical protein
MQENAMAICLATELEAGWLAEIGLVLFENLDRIYWTGHMRSRPPIVNGPRPSFGWCNGLQSPTGRT